MNKRFKDVVTMFMGTGINIVLGIITVPIITHIVEPSIYGQASLIQTYINVFVTLSLLGLDQAYVRFFYSFDGIDYKVDLSKKIILVPAAISCLVLLFIATFKLRILDNEPFIGVIVGLCIPFTVIDTFTKLCVRLQQNAKLYTTLLIAHRIAYATIIICLIVLFKVDVLVAMLLGTLLSIMISAIIGGLAERKIWFGKRTSTRRTISYKELFKYSVPFIFSSVAGWVFNAADKIALQYYSTYEQIGFYSAAANIVVFISVFHTTFSTVWIPMAVQTFEKNPDNKEFFVKSNNIMAVIMFFVGSSLVLVKDIFDFVLGGNYHIAKYIFPCLLIHPIMFTLSETTVYGINFYKKTHWHIVITSVSCIFNIILNFSFVPLWGSRGAAISTGLAYILFFVLRTTISRRYYKVDFQFGKLSCLIVLFTIFAIYSTFYDTGIMSFVLYFTILAAICLMYRKTIMDLTKEVIQNIKKK